MRYLEFLNAYDSEQPPMTPSEAVLMADLMLLSTKPLNHPLKQLLMNISSLINSSEQPTCFISYAWVSENVFPEQLWTQEFIYRLEYWLRLAGIKTTIDRNDSRFGNQMPSFMEERVRDSHFVILVGTKALRAKLDSEEKFNVKKEYKFIQKRIEKEEIEKKLHNASVLPIIISGKGKQALPEELFGKIAIEDFSGNELRSGQINALLDYLELLIAKLHSIPFKDDTNPLTQAYKALWDTFKRQYILCCGNHAGNVSMETQPPFLYFQQAKTRQHYFGKLKYHRHLNVPEDKGQAYVGRHEELIALAERINQNSKPEHSLVTVISGIGGIGKTTLAKRLVWSIQNQVGTEVRPTYWIRVNDQIDNSLYNQLIQIFGLNIGSTEHRQQQQWLFDWLRDRPGWILVLDNVTDQEQIRSYLPPSGGNIIITSRSNVWGPDPQLTQYNLHKLTESESYDLFQQVIKDDNEQDLKRLAKELDYLPLAIVQARAYLAANKDFMTAVDYLQLLAKQPTQLSQHYKESKSVWLTLNISLNMIRGTSVGAISLLNLCSMFSGLDIPRDFLMEMAGLAFEQLMISLNPIFSYYIASANKQNNTLALHPLVSAIVFDSLEISEKKRLLEEGLAAINRTLPIHTEPSTFQTTLIGFFLELSRKANGLDNTVSAIDETLFAETLLNVVPKLLDQDNMPALEQLVTRWEKLCDVPVIVANANLHFRLLDKLLSYRIKTRTGFSFLEAKFNQFAENLPMAELIPKMKFNQGRIAFELQRYGVCVEYLFFAIQSGELTDNEIAQAYANICAAYPQLNKSLEEVEAIVVFANAAVKKLLPSVETIWLNTYIKGNIAEYFVKNGKWQEAKLLREENIVELETVTTRSTDRALSWNFWSLANIECLFGDLELSKNHFQQFIDKMNKVFGQLSNWPKLYLEKLHELDDKIKQRELDETSQIKQNFAM